MSRLTTGRADERREAAGAGASARKVVGSGVRARVRGSGEAGMGGGKRGTGEAAGEKAGRRRAGDAADEPGCREPAGRGGTARPGGMALVDPWGALLAGLLVAEEEEPATDDAGGEARGDDGRERSDPIAPAKVRRTGTRRGPPRGPAGGR